MTEQLAELRAAILHLVGFENVTLEEAQELAEAMLERTPDYAQPVMQVREFLREMEVPLAHPKAIADPLAATADIARLGVLERWLHRREEGLEGIQGKAWLCHAQVVSVVCQVVAAAMLLSHLAEAGAYVPAESGVLAELGEMNWPRPPWEEAEAEAWEAGG